VRVSQEFDGIAVRMPTAEVHTSSTPKAPLQLGRTDIMRHYRAFKGGGVNRSQSRGRELRFTGNFF
jgi:hypothetical protein